MRGAIRTIKPAVWLAAVLLITVCSAALGADNWQWLETPDDPAALVWAAEQTMRSEQALQDLPHYAEVLNRLRGLMGAAELSPQISILDEARLIRFQRSAAHPDGVLAIASWQSNGELGSWHEVFDVADFNRAQGQQHELRWQNASAHCLPPAMNRCLLALAPGGLDDVILQEFDLISGTFVSDGFAVPLSRTWAAWLNEDELLVQHTLGAVARTMTGWPAEAQIWQRGSPLASARTVFSAEPGDALFSFSGRGQGPDRSAVIVRAIDYSHFEFWHLRQAGEPQRIALPQRVKMMFPAVVSDRHLFVQLAAPAVVGDEELAAETVLAYDLSLAADLENPVSVAYRPAPGEYIINALLGGLAASADQLWLALDRRGTQHIAVARWQDGEWRLSHQPAEAPGQSVWFADAHPLSAAVIMHRSGFLKPTELTWVDGRSARQQRLYEGRELFDSGGFEVSLGSAPSADGTEIDYFLLAPADRAGAPWPMLMTGYGAFGISLSPSYLDFWVGGRTLALWLERGGALAVPLIRGGGERGSAWHLAAMREHRQRSYDDFAAVAQALIDLGRTTPGQLGVFGMSNGGLLAAVMGTQRPDLFSAVVSDVPLADMLRYPQMGMGAAWINEYGDPADPAMAAVLSGYSPVHNASPGRDYPAFLITIATTDNRVGPGHARKLAAQLQAAGAAVFFIEDGQGGHGVSDPLSRPELMAKRMSFLLAVLAGDGEI